MCGYAGYVAKSGRLDDYSIQSLNTLDELLFHRGPDEGGVKVGEGFAVVHRRLSIIDSAHGQQPMYRQGERLGIAYNGEIYNFKALKAGLESDGYAFQTDCDTEVLLALFERDGVDCFRALDGMFSAFIWDFRTSPEGEYYLVRDQLGIKPMYLYEDAGKFAFSSELVPLIAVTGPDLEPDAEGLASYLRFRYIAGSKTFFKQIRRIEAGCYVRIAGGTATTWRYWDLPVDGKNSTLSLDEAAEELRHRLRASVLQQQMSEVPVGLLLSGGLDSSAIAWLCADIGVSMTSFSIGFPDLNEFEYSKAVADRFGLPHVSVETTPKEIIARFDAVVRAMDEPIADPACFPLHILCESIKQQVTVVLSGEGSDEMLAGYPQHAITRGSVPARQDELFSTFLRNSWYYFEKDLPLKGFNATMKQLGQKIYFDERPLVGGMLAFDQKTWLPENLMAKADKILMAHSLEGRFPFLSTQIVEFAASLPEKYLLDGGIGKIVLRKALEGKLPPSVLTRKKMGFSVPVADSLLQMKGRLAELVSKGGGFFADLLDRQALERDMADHFSGRREQSLWLWTVLVLLQWEDQIDNLRRNEGFTKAA